MTNKGGPKTIEGKLISSQNSLKHGLTAKRWLDHEEEGRYQDLINQLTEEHEPSGTLEHIQIERIANCKVRLERIQSIETAMFLQAQRRSEDPTQFVESWGFDMENDRLVVQEFGKELAGIYQTPIGLDDRDIVIEIACHNLCNINSMDDFRSEMPNLHEHLIGECIKRNTDIGEYIKAYRKGVDRLPSISNGSKERNYEDDKNNVLKNSNGKFSISDLHDYIEIKAEEFSMLQGLQKLKGEYFEQLELAKAAATPSNSDMAKIHKERVATDKQLSKAIGELLELQERRFKKERILKMSH
ncbi:hypothetical protein XMD579_000491 [Marinobacterium sp. xm-d-579]|uniref:hypothetical protein n=1 Tax=Marinobacterium sp. xm-d-579 TaxID=2497734 RepID=UPI0015690181|nr:hypothetical protein [Marinobacterium sp. xm-d-579]NRP35686.1 hypothetical protein [Marinobacterium sp. xm-d-579]